MTLALHILAAMAIAFVLVALWRHALLLVLIALACIALPVAALGLLAVVLAGSLIGFAVTLAGIVTGARKPSRKETQA